MSAAEIREGLALMRAGHAMIAAASCDACTKAEALEFPDELELLKCHLPSLSLRLVA